ncbi:RIB43A-like with coiled-coils protein 2 [Pocillopora verrucosa]|uniref:RIB43A-like with coiled-coils protein 2 n=1 Tax=Pocillopora verrucosa TaxID=203993 RepID=UPI0033416010
MYKLDLPVDMKESAAIERRRNRELQRQSRIFNARVRTIGIDLNALNEQVQDRTRREVEEERRHNAFAADMTRNDKITVLLQKRQEHDMRELNKAVNEFRQSYQQPYDRREFDLNDPDSLKKDKPARVSDDDPRCGVASLQKFVGEDLNGKAREKLQQEQAREWIKQQTNEKDQALANQTYADHLYDLKAREMDQRACELASAEADCRRAINMATKDMNQALARERKAKEDSDKQQEQDDNFTEISNSVFGDMLTENPDVAQSAFGPHRVITDRWKGMSPAQLAEIRRIQQAQVEEKERLKQEEEEQEKEYNRLRLTQAKAGIIAERGIERKKKEIEKDQADENRRLAAEQRAKMDYLDKEVYTNPPTAAYFMQYNTTSR